MNTILKAAVLDARLALLDALIAKTERPRNIDICYRLASRPLAFALPVSHVDPKAKVCVWGSSDAGWEHLCEYALTQGAVLPADSRWAHPTYVTGDVDPSVAFAVAVGIEEVS